MLSKRNVITTSLSQRDSIQFHAHHHHCNAGTYTPPLLLSYTHAEFHLPLCCSGMQYEKILPWFFAVSLCLNILNKLVLPSDLSTYCSPWFLEHLWKYGTIWAVAQPSGRFCCANGLAIPLCCFPSFKQLVTHVRNLWRLFPVRPLGEALFQMPLWTPWGPHHPDLFVHLPGDSFKGLLKICEPCPPFSFLNT